MLNEGTVFATIAVKDIEQAKEFYGEKLKLQQVDENPGGVTYQSGGGRLFVYQSAFAGTNQATCASWEVADVDATVEDLKGKGLTFERYDFPGVVMEGDVHVMGNMRAGWFKDPDGNILAIANSVK